MADNIYSIFKYSLNDIFVIIENSDEDIKISKKDITSIFIEKDYENAFFPILRIDCVIDNNVYDKIMINKTKIRFKVNLSKFIMNKDFDTNYDPNNIIYTDVINSTFRLVDDELDISHRYRIDKTDQSTDEEIAPTKNSMNKSFYLFNDTHISRYRELINIIFRNTSVTDMIAYGFKKCNIDKVLMTPLDNRNIYIETKIEPTTLIGFINTLHQLRGLYNTGYTLFQDFDLLYLINKESKCSAYRSNELKSVYLNIGDINNNTDTIFGCFENIDENRYEMNVISKDVEITNKAIPNKELYYNKFITVGKDGSIDRHEISLNGFGEHKTTKIFENKYSNQYLSNSVKHSLEESNIVMTTSIAEIDIDSITCNKEYIVNFKDLKLNEMFGGYYRLIKSTMALYKEGGEEFSLMTFNELRKT